MSKGQILIVEDDRIVAKDIKNSLETLGFTVSAIASSGEETLNKAKEEPPDLVLMDIMLEGEMDGIETAAKIRTQFDIPVVYLTGYADEKVLQRAKITEPFGYVLKPFEERELNTAIEIALYKHKMEKKLREHEQWLSTTLKSIGDAVIATDTEGAVTFMNPVAEFLTGWSQEDAKNKPLKDVFHIINENTRKQVESPLTKVLQEGKVVGLANHTLLIAKDGLEIPIDDCGAPIKDEKGNIKGVVIVFRDVREKRQAEESLRKSEEKYRTLIDNSSEAIIVAQDGVIKFANPQGEALYGYSQKELVSRPLTDFIHEEDREMVGEHHDKRLRGEVLSSTYPFRIVHKSGHVKWVELNVVLFSWDERPAALCLMADITGRKKMQEELLKNEKLQSVGVLAGGLAHDFNNILAVILGNVSLAKMEVAQGGDPSEVLSEAEIATIRAQSLTRQLLTFSKGGAPIKKLASVSDAIKETAEFALRGSNARCEFRIADDPLLAEIDVGQMSQVIQNLVINADQAMPQGGTIHVGVENVTLSVKDALPLEPGKYISISIQDQGTGIPQEHLSKVFDPYFTTKHAGSGLGLATTHSIVNKHGGHISVESQLGVGTTFHIHLPASEKTTLKPEKKEEKPIMGQGRILLMDDEKSLRKMAGKVLAKLGYETEFAKDGAEAIDLFKKARESDKPFDAVILDLTIPGGMGGKETVKKLQEIDPEVRAIVSSGYSNDPVMSNFRDYGFRGMVPKPFETKELSKALYEVLKK